MCVDCPVGLICRLVFFFNGTATTEIYTNRSSAASDVYKRQGRPRGTRLAELDAALADPRAPGGRVTGRGGAGLGLSLIHISEPTRPY